MKTQIIKIIPCLLAGFILSACVGAVNLAEGAVENIKNNTKEEPIVDDKDPESIVVDPEVALINRCTTKDLASDASCAPIVADHPCIEDPFGGACDITFTDYYKTARVNRISFCRENPTNNLCVGAIENVCNDNPLDADLCFNDNTYHKTHEQMCEAEPTAPRCQTTVSRFCSDSGNVFHGLCLNNPIYEPVRIGDCITAGNAGETRCTGAFTAEHCALNPFSVNCDNENYISTARDNRVNFCKSASGSDGICASFTACEANPYGAGCGTHFEYKRRPNVASLLQSFDSPLPKFPNADNPKNEFLQGTRNGLDFGDSGVGNGTIATLNLATGNGYRDLGGDEEDGVVFYSGLFMGNSVRYYYAGIFSGTDLGLPRTETSGTAMWNGLFRAAGVNRINVGVNQDFILTVNFGAGNEAGQIEAFVKINSSSFGYYLTGNFNSRGVITGTVEARRLDNFTGDDQANPSAYFTNPDGKLTGLIGQEGAVGAFISDTGWNYSGGFVARPPE